MAAYARNVLDTVNYSPPTPQERAYSQQKYQIGYWFQETWTSEQRYDLLETLILACNAGEALQLRGLLDTILPEETDPLKILPRGVFIKVLSYLDPRSLSRCARVSHSWRGVSEVDGLWKMKCLKRGWPLPYVTTQFEQGAWKAHYISQVIQIRAMQAKKEKPVIMIPKLPKHTDESDDDESDEDAEMKVLQDTGLIRCQKQLYLRSCKKMELHVTKSIKRL
eukprot:m.164910 g.164910  ORF g.164910 m.164910 type:complete len:222 (+) comp15249_c0_seq1:72-737(+)